MKKTAISATNTTQDFFNRITVRFTDNNVNKQGNKKLYLQLFIMKRKVMLPIGIFVEPIYWDQTMQRVTSSHPKHEELNMVIRKAIGIVNDIFIKYYLSDSTLTPDKMRAEYLNPTIQVDFYAWMDQTIRERKGVITQSSITMHLSVLNKMKGFRKDLAFAEIDKKFIDDLQKYFKVKLNNNNNTINKCLKTLKTYVNIAVERDYIKKNPFADYKKKPVTVNRVALDQEEIAKLLDVFFKKQGNIMQLQALRLFLFSTFACGLRISDIRKLEWKNVINDQLIFVPHKTANVTGKVLHLPLKKMALKLLRHENKFAVQGKVFECMADQTINKLLKEICIIHKINKNISFHSARHSFATIFLKHNRGDIATLKELMGHAKIEQTMVYVHIDEEDKRRSLAYMDQMV